MLLTVLLVSLFSGCGDDPAAIEVEVEVAGRYRVGFELSELVVCGSSERWWVTDPDGLLQGYESIVEDVDEGIFVSVAGDVSEYGHCGHMGACAREIAITAVHEAHAWSDGDCSK